MTASFDTAIPELVAITEAFPGFDELRRLCLVRDLRGRVRLVVDGPEGFDREGLAERLRASLGPWFHGPILNLASGAVAENRLAREILDRARGWPSAWPTRYPDPTGAPVEIAKTWTGYQRVLSKQAWLDGRAAGACWPLSEGNPAVVAFFSFKGGVGRSTLLGVVAWKLAKEGKKVVCLDLDLEAPGLGALFDVAPGEQLIDHLLMHAATGRLPGRDPVAWIRVHEAEIGVVSAGRMDRGYIEKLARLDYLGSSAGDESPVARALARVLERIRGQHRPDYILLDCRTGLHDLGGLSLTDVAHVDVLVGRDTPAAREGLSLTLEVLHARRRERDQRILIAQTFVPLPLKGEEALTTRARFRRAMYDACADSLYRALDDVPGEEDDTAAHHPWPVGRYDEIASAERLADLSRSLLDNDAFAAVVERLRALSLPEEG